MAWEYPISFYCEIKVIIIIILTNLKTFFQREVLQEKKKNYFLCITQPQSVFPCCSKLLLKSAIDSLDFIELDSLFQIIVLCRKYTKSLFHDLSTLQEKGKVSHSFYAEGPQENVFCDLIFHQ